MAELGAPATDELNDTANGEAAAAHPIGENHQPPHQRDHMWTLITGVACVMALAALAGWLGYRAYESNQAEQDQRIFLQAGRQAALNLTTIDYRHVDADVQRILDSLTGSFRGDFQNRSGPFVGAIKQANSTSAGTITEAGLESDSSDHATVLVAVSVKMANSEAPQQQPRAWRMRLTVSKAGDGAKVSNVEFVP
jgi:Mce-associated membrane protein